jgi:hypothetical protein
MHAHAEGSSQLKRCLQGDKTNLEESNPVQEAHFVSCFDQLDDVVRNNLRDEMRNSREECTCMNSLRSPFPCISHVAAQTAAHQNALAYPGSRSGWVQGYLARGFLGAKCFRN